MYITYRDIFSTIIVVLLVDILAIYRGKKATLTLHKRDKRQAKSDGRENSLTLR